MKRLWLAGVAAMALGGCDACRSELKEQLKEAPPEVVHPKIIERLRTAKEIASNMCGLPSAGLVDVKLTPQKSLLELPNIGDVQVEGVPAERPRGDGGAPLVCIAVLWYSVHGVTQKDGTKAPQLAKLELSSVQTPGVRWTAPPSHHDSD